MEHRSGPVPQISSAHQSTNSPSTASPCHSHSPHCSLERFSHACRHACLRSFPAFNASFKCNHRRRGPSSLGAARGPTPRSFNNSKSLAGPIASPTLDFLCGLPFLAFGFLCEWPRNLPFSETRCRKKCVRKKTYIAFGCMRIPSSLIVIPFFKYMSCSPLAGKWGPSTFSSNSAFEPFYITWQTR